MAVDRQFRNRVYGIGDTTFDLPPEPIVAQRAPTASDRAQIGSIWIDQTTENGYILVAVAANVSSWQIMTAEGTGGTDGQVLIGSTASDPDWANITSTGGTLVITNGSNTINMEVSGATTSSFPTDSGTANPLLGATNIAGGTNINTAGAGNSVTVNLDASPSVAGSITVGDTLTMSAGTCTITADDNTADVIYLHADGGTSETIRLHADQGTGVASIGLISDVGGITLDSGLASADAINIDASNAAGGIDIDFGSGGCAVDGANGAFTLQTGTGAINLGADAAAKAITIGNATGASSVTVDVGTGTASFGASATAHATVIGGTNTTSSTTVQSGTGDLTMTSTDAVTIDGVGVVEINSSGGIIGIGNDAVAQNINVGTGAAARVITIGNVSGASQVVLNSGTAGIALASTGAGDITIDSDDTLLLDADGVLELNSSAGIIGIGNDADAFGINIGTGAAQRDIVIGNGTGTTSFTLNAGTGAVDIGANAVAHTLTLGNVTGATQVDVNTGTGGFNVATTGTGDITLDSDDTMLLDADGVLELNSSAGAINIGNDGDAQPVNICTGAAARDLTLGSTNTTSSTTVQSGTGGISIEAAGIVDMVPATATVAGVGLTINANVGVATFTGQTTASAASQVFTITNSVATVGSAILVSAANLGANDAQMTITRVTPAAGSFTVTLTNNGAAALNGDVLITFWIIAA